LDFCQFRFVANLVPLTLGLKLVQLGFVFECGKPDGLCRFFRQPILSLFPSLLDFLLPAVVGVLGSLLRIQQLLP
jgi:hypothetical protein